MTDTQIHKQKLLDQLYAPYTKCQQCPLGSLGRSHVVFGQGNPDAHLMFIGEGPGEQEDHQGLPFVGRAGKLLNKVFELAGITRANVFITNIVKCRPPNNRKPFPLEMKTCKSILLDHQIEIIKPTVICTLGSAAIQGLTGDETLKISKIRGIPQENLISSCIILPTYHPAYILRNPPELATMHDDIVKAYALSQKRKSHE